MAITHFTPRMIGRANGRSAVLAAAYRHTARMEHEAEGRVVDYSRKVGMVHEEFVLPPGAPAWVKTLVADRSVAGASEVFWNRVEAFETRRDAQLAKEYVIALPVELTRDQNIDLVRAFVETEILARGRVADWVYHDDPGNPHVHLMTSLRPFVETGFGDKKVAVVADDGRPLRNAMGKIVYRLWSGDKTDFLAGRRAWIDLQNVHLAKAGLDIRVDGRSHAERGLDLVPETHVGVGAKAIERKVGRSERPDLERLAARDAARAENLKRITRRPEIVLDLLTRERSVFDRRDVAKVLHRFVDDAATFERLLTRVLANPSVVRLERERIDVGTGARVSERYTTRDLLRLEAEMAARASRLAGASGFRVEPKARATILARHERLSDEQRAAIDHVTTEARIAAIVGRAGAGKTTTMKAAREVWEAAGYRVVGAALAGKAAEGLEAEAGIRSETLAAWELRWSKRRDLLDAKTVFVLDEAGMIGSRQMAHVLEAVAKAGAKLVLVGDPDQLQPIEAGAAFRVLANRVGYAELGTIRRQSEDWMRAASLDLARGRIGEALAAYRDHGRLVGRATKAEAMKALVDDWVRAYDPDRSQLILAHLRRDVRALNAAVRERLAERGLVGEAHSFATVDGERHFGIGDQMVFLRNEGSLGVKNGMIGRVAEARAGRITVEVGRGEGSTHTVVVDQRFYGDLDHGWATTIHKAQGVTVDRVAVLATLSLDRHLGYVALTRHRDDVALYWGRRSFEHAGGLEAVLSRTNSKATTLDCEGSPDYRAALRFAEARGLHLVRVARTLVADRLAWIATQKTKLGALADRLEQFGARLVGDRSVGLGPMSKKEPPMVAGRTVFDRPLESAVEDRIAADRTVTKAWGDVRSRAALVFADPVPALQALALETLLADPARAEAAVTRLVAELSTVGALRGGTGWLADRTARAERRQAEENVAALGRDLERWLRLRTEAEVRFRAEEQTVRARAAVDIPAISAEATRVLERVRDAIDRNDLPAALEFVLADRMVGAEIEGIAKAVAERFGERAGRTHATARAAGPAFDELAAGVAPAERERLAKAWPLLSAARQVVEAEKAEAVKVAQAERQTRTRGVRLQ